MAITLLIIAIALVFGSALAVASRISHIRSASDPRKNRSSLLAEFDAGCRALSATACAPFEPRLADSAGVSVSPESARNGLLPVHAPAFLDQPALLPRRLRSLDIEPGEFVRLEPHVFRRLSIQCARCANAERCAKDLGDDTTSQSDESWTEYCPNASMLRMVGTWSGIGMSYGEWKNQTAASSALVN